MINSSIIVGAAIFVLVILLFFIVIKVLEVIGKWKLFEKAGKKGWEAIIPYYSSWVLVEISGCEWWFFLIIMFSSIMSVSLSYNSELADISVNGLSIIGF